jgi:alanine racemase
MGFIIERMTPFPELTTYAQIDLDALDHNVRALKAHIGPSVELIAVVKSNAYGHGAVPMGRAAIASGPTRLAVARPDEGIQLRRAGIAAPILVMGYTIPAETGIYADHRLTATLNTLEAAHALSARA